MKNPTRKFRDLIKNASAMWPVWHPASAAAADIKVGDYGHIDDDGEFYKEGTIINNPEFAGLFPSTVDLTAIQPVAEDRLVIVSKTARTINVEAGANAIGEAEFKGGWNFGNHSGALIVAYKPQQWSLPTEVNWKEFIAHPGLKGKCVVKDVWRCPAYASYLAEKGGNEIALGLKAAALPGAHFYASGSWVTSHGGGVFRSAGLHDPPAYAASSATSTPDTTLPTPLPEPKYTILYTLRQPKKFSFVTGWREDIRRDDILHDWMHICDEDLPWGPLDDDGEVEKDKTKLFAPLESLIPESDSEDEEYEDEGDEDEGEGEGAKEDKPAPATEAKKDDDDE